MDDRATFEYVTFHTHATFRGAKFLGGLDLDRANFSDEANFLGVDVDGGDVSKTTRETYRLIKHSFDSIGNHLEANKFFAKEMDKYHKELDSGRLTFSNIHNIKVLPKEENKNLLALADLFFPWLMLFLYFIFTAPLYLLLLITLLYSTPFLTERIHLGNILQNFFHWISGVNEKVPVYWFNKISSDFGQSYIRPAVGMLILVSAHVVSIRCFGSSLDLQENYNPCSPEISGILGYLNCGASLVPFSNVLISGMELLSLMFYLIFAALFWQFVVALKRHTRR
ncbi:hypothetical protein [Marinospirillum sp.]|uniref:hypothetical protein n=1 Tax=Marinospirillum sp. TaxID=2183934 RepID=UPI00384DF0EC